jgi:hypothetical protein
LQDAFDRGPNGLFRKTLGFCFFFDFFNDHSDPRKVPQRFNLDWGSSSSQAKIKIKAR